MTALEIILLVAGAAVFVLSFVIPSKKQEASDEVRTMIEEEVKKKVTEEVDGIKKHVDGVVDEAVQYAQEKTERGLERISNEKIMAVNEYSTTVLEEINKNHKEVMFLYDMLNDKHDSLVNAVSEANQVITETKESTAKANEAANAVKESTAIANEVANVVKSSTKEAAETVNTFRSLSPDSIVMPEFDIAQVLKHSQDAINTVNLPSSAAEATVVNAEAAKQSQKAEAKSDANDEPEYTKETADKMLEADAAANAPQNTEENAGGKVRTLKWAELAMQQADEAYENKAEDKAQSTDKVGMTLAASTEEERNVIQEAVLKLHDAGKSDIEIARSLDMGVGEVSLIIGLRGKEQ